VTSIFPACRACKETTNPLPAVPGRSIGLRPAAGWFASEHAVSFWNHRRAASPDDPEQFLELGKRTVRHGASWPRGGHAQRDDEVLPRTHTSRLLAGLGLRRESHDDVPFRPSVGQRCGIVNTLLYEGSRERSVEVSVKTHFMKSPFGGPVRTGMLSSDGVSL
jgi:hypothetical protein